MQDDLSTIVKEEEFVALRNEKVADLVQLIGFYAGGRECGAG